MYTNISPPPKKKKLLFKFIELYSSKMQCTCFMQNPFLFTYNKSHGIHVLNYFTLQMWTDYGLRWDPKEYGDIKVVRLPYDQIWRPDIFLYNK